MFQHKSWQLHNYPTKNCFFSEKKPAFVFLFVLGCVWKINANNIERAYSIIKNLIEAKYRQGAAAAPLTTSVIPQFGCFISLSRSSYPFRMIFRDFRLQVIITFFLIHCEEIWFIHIATLTRPLHRTPASYWESQLLRHDWNNKGVFCYLMTIFFLLQNMQRINTLYPKSIHQQKNLPLSLP